MSNNHNHDDIDNEEEDNDNEWVNWKPIGGLDREDILRKIEECTKAGIHIRLLRIRDYNTGKESLMIQKRAEIKEGKME
jgi:hypothetical protein